MDDTFTARFHWQRTDGVFVAAVLDPLGEHDAGGALKEIQKEAALLRAAGYRVFDARELPCWRCGYAPGPDWLDDGETCPKCKLVQ